MTESRHLSSNHVTYFYTQGKAQMRDPISDQKITVSDKTIKIMKWEYRTRLGAKHVHNHAHAFPSPFPPSI